MNAIQRLPAGHLKIHLFSIARVEVININNCKIIIPYPITNVYCFPPKYLLTLFPSFLRFY